MTYIHTCVPDFPVEDRTSLDAQDKRVRELLAIHRDTLKTDDQQTWHKVTEAELVEAFELLASSDPDKGRHILGRAIEHFRQSLKRKKIRPDFLIGPKGEIHKV